MTSKYLLDDEYSSAFLLTHHSFCTSATLLDLLIKRYDITPPYGLNQRLFEIYLNKKIIQVRLKVCQTISYWIQNHFEEDFADNSHLIERLRDFISSKVMVDFETMAQQMSDILSNQINGEQEKTRIVIPITSEKTKPILGSLRFGFDVISNLASDPRAFLDLDPLEMARQLTLLEHELYCKFQAYECLDQIWESYYKKEVASYQNPRSSKPKRHTPGSQNSDISKMIRHTNEVNFLVNLIHV